MELDSELVQVVVVDAEVVGEPKTIERMQYMLMNNKPLRN